MMTVADRSEWVFDRRTSAVARAEFDRWAQGHQIRSEDRDRLALVLSELVANAAQATPEPFTVAATLNESAGRQVRLTVINEGRFDDIPDRSDWGPAEPMSIRGRGLEVVEALADDVEVLRPSSETVAVAATLSLLQ